MDSAEDIRAIFTIIIHVLQFILFIYYFAETMLNNFIVALLGVRNDGSSLDMPLRSLLIKRFATISLFMAILFIGIIIRLTVDLYPEDHVPDSYWNTTSTMNTSQVQ